MSRAPEVTADTRLFCLLGDPVEHSLSPVMQNAGFREAGVDGIYVALRSSADDVPALIRAVARAGGGGNVTIPHKKRAASAVEAPSAAVRRTDACNTFWAEDGTVRGDNSDVEGFRRAAEDFLGRSPRGARVLLLGAGGAARAVLVALLGAGAEEVVILNRTVERARSVAERLDDGRLTVAASAREIRSEPFDLAVNATPLGLSAGDPLPLDLDRPGPTGAVMDLVYGEDATRLVREARRRGIAATDGGEMLVRQGAVSFERWWGRPAPVEAMRRALDRARERSAPARSGSGE